MTTDPTTVERRGMRLSCDRCGTSIAVDLAGAGVNTPHVVNRLRGAFLAVARSLGWRRGVLTCNHALADDDPNVLQDLCPGCAANGRDG